MRQQWLSVAAMARDDEGLWRRTGCACLFENGGLRFNVGHMAVESIGTEIGGRK